MLSVIFSRLWLGLPLAIAWDLSEVESCILNFVACIDVLSDDEAEQEAIASKLLQSWLQSISAKEGYDGAMHRVEAFAYLLELAAAVPMKPVLALGVGQALHSFFWWGDRPEETSASELPRLNKPSVKVMKTALGLHEKALQVAGCDSPRMSEAFLTRPVGKSRFQLSELVAGEPRPKARRVLIETPFRSEPLLCPAAATAQLPAPVARPACACVAATVAQGSLREQTDKAQLAAARLWTRMAEDIREDSSVLLSIPQISGEDSCFLFLDRAAPTLQKHLAGGKQWLEFARAFLGLRRHGPAQQI
eukprot:s2097_g6.t1